MGLKAQIEAGEDSSLFVYGKLIEASLRDRLLGHPARTLPARLPNYERRRSRYYYVVKQAGRETAGLVLLGLGAADFKVLDRYEEVPRLYMRERAEVIIGEGQRLRCWLYVPTPRLMAGAE